MNCDAAPKEGNLHTNVRICGDWWVYWPYGLCKRWDRWLHVVPFFEMWYTRFTAYICSG